MQFQTPLIRAKLIRRYKRFLADIVLPDGREVTAHCANPGAMTGLKAEGANIWVEPNDNPKRKLNFSWKLIELANGHWAGIDTNFANPVVAEAISRGRVAELAKYKSFRREVKYGKNSRIDLLLTQQGLADAYVEVKAVTFCRKKGLAEFPDSVTARGTKHLYELSEMVQQGHRAVMLYAVHRTDCTAFSIATDIDPGYALAYDFALKSGVEMLSYDMDISPRAEVLRRQLPVLPVKQI